MRVGSYLQQKYAGHADGEQLAARRGYVRTVQYLREVLRISTAEAKARLVGHERWHARRALTGEPLEPAYPAVAEAVRGGAISTRHAQEITTVVSRLPESLGPETRTDAEKYLVEKAREHDPAMLHKHAQVLVSYLDPDGLLTEEREQRARESFTLSADVHGMYKGTWWMTAETKSLVDTVIGPLAKPTGSKQSPDPRRPEKRRSDALARVFQHALNGNDLPIVAGRRPQVTLTTSVADLLLGQGVARLNHGDLVSMDTVIQTLCDADVNLAVFGGPGELLYYGRTRRTASPAQKQALFVRDGGCAFGCDTPLEYLQAHHVNEWAADDGNTDVDEMCLVCDIEHGWVHHEGWQIQMIKGRPAVIPPPWIDPDQKPRHATRNHPPALGP
ncbi:MAG TPA: DUF222 domain-containing protein [Streptosporangiales bacterium]